ncbi:glutaredoxin domain-containing protein [Reinekea sp. G2M2-21]|uniref:glutaredoxin domain-containing protein n=1 Tax=Reinekea sp. G2M2-21 TaxID=2788942 RepID=UPI0018AB58B2|nr:glutaredoxin domain-containing protein [Reinekea sp. G2M2-21]
MRPILETEHIHPAIHDKLGGDQTLVNEVKKAIAEHPVVVVGMRQNPVVKAARKLLDEKGVAYEYLEYGSYFSMWRERLAIKMWTGLQTFPQIFVAGTLVGGHSDLKALFDSGDASSLHDALAAQG